MIFLPMVSLSPGSGFPLAYEYLPIKNLIQAWFVLLYLYYVLPPFFCGGLIASRFQVIHFRVSYST